MTELRFALGYMPHRLWGKILQAQLLDQEEGKAFFIPSEFVQNDESTMAYGRLTPMQKEVVKLIDAYSDRNLHRKFSKKKTAKDFLDTVDKETIRDHIRPYIEKQLYKALLIARDNRISLFVKEKSNRNIYPEDFIRIEKQAAHPIFNFSLSEELSYTLKLIHGGELLALNKLHADIISFSPTAVILGSSLYFIEAIDGKKLKPFLEKDEVVIPAEMVQKYLSTFVKNTLRDFDTRAEGFEVDEQSSDKKSNLVLEEGLNKNPVLILSFYYNQQHIYPDSLLRKFVNYKNENDDHKFEIYHRDFTWEEELFRVLNELGLNSRDQKNFYLKQKFNKYAENSLYTAINFLNEAGPTLADSGINVRHRLQNNYYLGTLSLEMESHEKEDWFDVMARVQFGEITLPFIRLKSHILGGIREYELPGGEIAVLPEEWFARYSTMFEFGRTEGERILIHKQHFSLVEGPLREFHTETLKHLEQLNQLTSLPPAKLPDGLKADLRDYQEEGFKWLCFLQEHGFGGCLADDMGLGKTLQAIAVLLRSKLLSSYRQEEESREGEQLDIFGKKSGKNTSLVVVPASLLHNWLSECRRFAPELKVHAHVGVKRNRELSNLSYYDVIVSTYHTVRQDVGKMAEFSFHYLILDESQMIKNPGSKIYQALIELKSDHRIVLTGTPIENSLTDLWSQINFVNPGLLGTLNFFKRSFVQPIEKKRDEIREEKLKELINPFILRRTKQEVARELPPVFEQVRYCSMTEPQRRLYDEEKSLARNSILENLDEIGLEKSSFMVLQALTRLRQIANHPNLLDDLEGYDSGKFAEVYRDIESVISEGHKVLVFSSFVKHLDLFKEQLDKDRTSYAYLTGSSSQKKRGEAVKEFQKKKECPLFLISLKAGGVGLNLTAADYVFILDPWWNPAAELQALNRAHRIGQEKNVFVYRFISSGTIEEKIRRLQERKQELAETFISSNNPLQNLTEKDLLDLFS